MDTDATFHDRRPDRALAFTVDRDHGHSSRLRRAERLDEPTTGLSEDPRTVVSVLGSVWVRWAALAMRPIATSQVTGTARGKQQDRQPAEYEQRNWNRRCA